MSKKNLKLAKYQLYFDRNRKIFIEFSIENIKYCIDICTLYNKEIEQKIEEIYGEEKSSKNFAFILINSKINTKAENNSPSIELKINNRRPIIKLLATNNYFLCYLPINKFDINLKKNVRKIIEDRNDNSTFGIELETLLNNNVEKYLNNETIYWFDKNKNEFLYGKGNIDEKKIEIITKKYKITIKINCIRKDNYYENEIPSLLEDVKIKIPNYIIEIFHNNVSHIFGLKNQKNFLIWKNAIKKAKIKYNNFYVNTSFNTNISTCVYQHFVRSQSIPNKLYTLNQILENYEKRKIFLDELTDKKMVDIISNIFLYKINLNKKKFFEACLCLKQISFYADFNNIITEAQKQIEIQKYSKIFTQERINLYNNITQKANDAMSQIKSIENYEKEMNIALESIFAQNLFDELYYQIYELYIEPNYEKVSNKLKTEYKLDKIPKVIKKYQLLLSNYCIKFFNMNNINNFNCFFISTYSNTNYTKNKLRNTISSKNLEIDTNINSNNQLDKKNINKNTRKTVSNKNLHSIDFSSNEEKSENKENIINSSE